MAKAGYVGNQPVRESQAESYPGAWTGQEQHQEARADNWPKSVYEVERSVRINSADNAYFSRTPSTTGNTRTWTWSGWIKRSALSAGNKTVFMATTDNYVNDYTRFIFTNNNIYINHSSGLGGARQSVAVYRDTAAWMHVVIALDTTQATAASRLRFYVNGQEITAYSGADPGLNAEWWVNSSSATHFIGTAAGQEGFDGYLANIHLIDGLALTPSAFGVTDPETNEWMPKKYTNSYGYGINGFWLKFADNSAATASAIGKDSSPNGNNWTPSGISVAAGAGNDSLVDTPTSYGIDTSVGGEVRGNYCTLNPLDRNPNFALSNGNLDGSTGTSIWRGARGTFGVTSGKWYFECIAGSADTMIGIADATTPITDPTFPGYTAYSYGYYGQGGVKYNNNAGTAYGSGYTATDVIGVAFDADNGKVFFSKNGVWQASGDPAAGTNAAFTGLTGRVFFPMLATYNTLVANFGQRPFAYTAPSGFKALCDTNLPTPVVAKPNTVFDVALWSGTSATQSITFQSGLSPDFVWIKARNAVANHVAFDAIRGSNKAIYPSLTNAEDTYTATLTSFDSSGFTLGSDDWSGVNQSGRTYVGWAWDAGSSNSTNTQGSITSTVRTNASAGFSIVTYTGGSTNATVGHGLNVAPELILCKSRSNTITWVVYHKSLGKDAYLFLNGTDAAGTGATNYWGTAGPTSSTFGLATNGFANNSGNMVAYCFAPVAGHSSFGSYTGNGSADGPFVYTGFRPRWILIKSTATIEGGGEWYLYDAARSTFNGQANKLYPNTSAAENSLLAETATTNLVDFLSNGFKLRSNNLNTNQSSTLYIYAAFAEFPFQYARAR